MEKIQELTIDSREVSQMVDKRHADLIRDIETYIDYFSQNAKLRSDDFFLKYQYQSGTGKNYKCYLVTKKGCEFLAHKLTGKKGAIFTATYINKFHDMEKQIQDKALVIQPTQLIMETEIPKKTYGGITVMTFDDVAYLLGISKDMAYYRVKQYDISYKVLYGQELIQFKKENKGMFGSVSAISIFYSASIIKLCKCMDINTSSVYEYFGFVPTAEIDTPKKKEETLNDMDIKKLEIAIKVLPYLTEDYRSYISGVIVTRMMGTKVMKDCIDLCE